MKKQKKNVGMGSGRNGKWKKWEVGGIGKREEWNGKEIRSERNMK